MKIDGVEQITPQQLQERLLHPNPPVVIDVREMDEYVSGHIPGIPLIQKGKIPGLISEFEKDKSYVFICRSGRRSQDAATYFIENGITSVANLDGGMIGWDGEIEVGEEWIPTTISELFRK